MAFIQNSFAEASTLNPAPHAEAITPADSDLTSGHFTRSIYVGGDGDLAVKMAGDQGDSIVVFKAVPAGSVLPIVCSQIRSTDTTATFIVAMW